MITHFNIGTNDLVKAEAFYTELLGLFGGKVAFKSDRSVFFTLGEGTTNLAVNLPFNGEPATAGNGAMVALQASGPEQVQAVYSKALSLGGLDEGEPGERMDGKLFAAYFRDLDGNKFGVFCQPNS